ncbi:MAG: tetratricopeptide repeat protein [Acidobacteria bacterium]|nr:tetratricopeptide repeat protein [Acidobacteriota bacterium]
MKKTKGKKSRPGSSHPRSDKKNPAAKRPVASKAPAVKRKVSSIPAVRKNRSQTSAAASPPPPVRRKPTAEEIAHQHSMERFENALQLFNENHLGRARGIFERLTNDPARELAQRARVYLRICDQRLSRATLQLKTAEDYYNYAVGLANEGNAEESEQYLLKALKLAPQADHIYYALATTYALRDDVDGALQHLLKAIQLSERNRFQAQNDADFANLLEDPRFTELLYPEKPLP